MNDRVTPWMPEQDRIRLAMLGKLLEELGEATQRAYGVPCNSPADVPENMREEFEAGLDYRLGACINLRTSRAIDPKRLTG